MSAYLELRKKDAKIAKWMGWYSVGKRRVVVGLSDEDRWMGLPPNPDAMTVIEIPCYCTNWSDCMAMQNRIPSGMQEMYIEYLIAIVVSERTDWDARSAFAVTNAKQEQRVDALLAVLNEHANG